MSRNRKVRDRVRDTERALPRGRGYEERQERRREVAGVVALGLIAFALVSMVSLQTGRNIMGPFGRVTATMVYGLAGLGSYVLLVLATVAAIRAIMERQPLMPLEVLFGTLLGVLAVGMLLQLAWGGYQVADFGPGGWAGEQLVGIARALIGTVGAALLASVGVVVAVVLATPLRMRDLLAILGRVGHFVWDGFMAAATAVGNFVADVFHAILPEREGSYQDDSEYDESEADDESVPVAVPARKRRELTRENAIEAQAQAALASPELATRAKRLAKAKLDRQEGVPGDELQGDTDVVPEPVFIEPKRGKIEVVDASSKPGEAAKPAVEQARARRRMAAGSKAGEPDVIGDDDTAMQAAAPPPAAVEANGAGPVIVEPRFRHADKAEMAAKEKAAEAERKNFIKLGEGEYQLPSIQLLKFDATGQNQVDKASMLELSARLGQTLDNYGVKGEVVAIRPGPVVTMYEFAPAPGTRVNKIVNLTDDLALALEALRVRIVAPIPGKAAVGIEVPNKAREKVFLKEIIADDAFRKGRARLPMALGKDIEGGPAVVDMARMPHLLVAGTTGSGKSVAVNAMIMSLLYHCTPEEVRMIMVDPKMLELSIYEGVPHLLLPVVTDPKKANLALRWAVEEMDRRYDLLAQSAVRDIATYNEKVGKLIAKHEADKLQAAANVAARVARRAAGEPIDPDDHSDDVIVSDTPQVVTQPPERLPYIVVIIDEFADLMMCAPKDVETSVARIAQKARASGIHLILATQRPSVDVITGLIKANFPSRIAFHVTSKIDSRTILDQTGAEALLGAGDMLFSDRGAAPQRLHGCYVDEDEIHSVVSFLKTQGRPVYNLEILKPRDEDGEGGEAGGGGKSEDDLYDKAVHIVTSSRNCSISWVQRQLRIGYNRAARLVEEMEKQGVVSPPDHTNKREVLANPS